MKVGDRVLVRVRISEIVEDCEGKFIGVVSIEPNGWSNKIRVQERDIIIEQLVSDDEFVGKHRD